MRLRRSIQPSIRALLAHRTRAMLALTSVSVGVAAVVLTSAVGTGAEQQIVRRIESVGSNLLIVRPTQVKRLVARKELFGSVTTLEIEDGDAIAALPLVADAAPGAERTLRVKAGTVAMTTNVLGTTPVFPAVRRFRVREGRFFDAEDNLASRRVAVLGARVRDTLFAGENPVGRDLRIRGVPFEVIGVFEPKGAVGDGGDEDNQVVIPIRTALRRVANATWLNAVYVSVVDLARMDDAQSAIGQLLRTRARHRAGGADPVRAGTVRVNADAGVSATATSGTHGGHGDWIANADTNANAGASGTANANEAVVNDAVRESAKAGAAGATRRDDFEIQNVTRFLVIQKQAADSLQLLTTGLGALALVVGGTGILALMLLAVRERTGEIGLRMAVGARPRDVLVQFLFEATLLALGGWIVGVALAACGAALVRVATAWPIAPPVDALLASLGMALIIGVGFGAYPARTASRLPPIDALRTE
jgi:putative ABC transport system permease protein